MVGTHVLDACSVIAFLRNEHGAATVETLFRQASEKEVTLLLHKITLVEILYDQIRVAGGNISSLIAAISRLPIEVTDSLDDDFITKAALYKASHKISFADTFVLALAEVHNATVVTSDRHEFGPIEENGILSFLWIR